MNPSTSAAALATAVKRGEISAEENVRSALENLAGLSSLGAVSEDLEDNALEAARRLDRRRAEGADCGPLAGVPIAVKDNICTHRGRTGCGSKILANYRSPFNATAVDRLEDAGAIVVAKTRCDEFGMGSSGETAREGASKNPWNPERVPGGSSSGSAVVIAGGAVPLALGSDTGGSVRQPAAFCGAVGLKPSYGRVSRWGLVAFGSSLDQIGTLASNVPDAALGLQVIAGADPRDATCSTADVPDYLQGLDDGPQNLRVGLIQEFLDHEDLHPRIRAAVESAGRELASAGAVVEPVSLPLARLGIPIYYLLAMAEASSNLARFDGVRYGHRGEAAEDLLAFYQENRGRGFGREVKRRIMLGSFVLSAGYHDKFYARAVRARQALREEAARLMESVDILLCPTTPQPAFRLGEKLDDPLEMYQGDLFTVLSSVTGQPALSLPAPERVDGLPVGVQLLAAPMNETTLLRAARFLESAGFRVDRPRAA